MCLHPACVSRTCTWCLAFSPFMLDGGATFSLCDMASSLHASIIHICNGTLFVRAMSQARKTPCRFWLLALCRLPLACMLPCHICNVLSATTVQCSPRTVGRPTWLGNLQMFVFSMHGYIALWYEAETSLPVIRS